MTDDQRKAVFRYEMNLGGLRPTDLALLLGVTRAAVSRWYSNRPGAFVPPYAVAYVRAWNLLDQPARAVLRNDSKRSQENQ